jgi:hypothetical protein
VAVYTYAQMMGLWIAAGGPKALAPVAAAIGEAESGGNSDAFNGHDTNGQGGTQVSAGIWQISNGTMTPVPGWSNPATNAQLAVGKWKGAGQSFSPWGTFTSGAYKAFLSPGTTADTNIPGSPTQLTAAEQVAASADCLVGNPFQASALGFSVSAGPTCLFTKSNARAFIGAGLLAGGVILAFDGGLFLMAGLAVRAVGGLAGGLAGAKKTAGQARGVWAIVPKPGGSPDPDTGARPRTEAPAWQPVADAGAEAAEWAPLAAA